MIARSLLLVLLGLVCIQSFTAGNVNEPDKCCFNYQSTKIAVKHIAAFKVTRIGCVKPGVIFTLNVGRQVCADPRDEWVQKNMKSLKERLITSN